MIRHCWAVLHHHFMLRQRHLRSHESRLTIAGKRNEDSPVFSIPSGCRLWTFVPPVEGYSNCARAVFKWSFFLYAGSETTAFRRAPGLEARVSNILLHELHATVSLAILRSSKIYHPKAREKHDQRRFFFILKIISTI